MGQAPVKRVGSEFIPGDAVVTALISVADTLGSEAAEMYPIEIADAWCTENFGLKASDIEHLKVVVGAPGPGEPLFAAIVTLAKDLDVTSINPQWIDTNQTLDVDGHTCFPVNNANGVVLHLQDARTVVIASSGYLDSVLRSAQSGAARGSLASMAGSLSHTGNVTVLLAVEPLRPMAMGLLQMQANQIPPPFLPFTKLPELIDAVLLRVNVADQQNGLNLVMLARDDAAAKELHGIIRGGLEMGRQIGLAQAMNELQDEDPVTEAGRQYADRISNVIVEMLTPELDGRRLSINGSLNQGMATQGVLVSLLLPAIQAARQAARRTSSQNNLKQMGLAFWNYHDVYRNFPTDIYDEDGNALLSWRVAILPFIEQNELYQRFHLDEPWDSPHNLALAKVVPPVFISPNQSTPSGTTPYLRPVGEKFLNNGAEKIQVRQITDGTSNTIFAVEALPDQAQPWTKPADLMVDPNNPLAGVIDGTRPSFTVLLGDGSVRDFMNDLDPEVFKALLTRNGGEVVQP